MTGIQRILSTKEKKESEANFIQHTATRKRRFHTRKNQLTRLSQNNKQHEQKSPSFMLNFNNVNNEYLSISDQLNKLNEH